MSRWNDAQLKQLKNLQRKLQRDERARENVEHHKVNPETSPKSSLDSLLARLASNEEGIQYHLDSGWVSAPFGYIDNELMSLTAHIGIGPRKMAIGLPRVPVGISTWLAFSEMVCRVVSSYDSSLGTSRKNAIWTLVVSRERAIRDLYLSQRLLFSHQTVDRFPVFRFRRDGSIQAISSALPNDYSAPVLFYHFDPLDFGKVSSAKKKIGLVLAEMNESDSRLCQVMLERLEALLDRAEDPKTIIFFNSFDKTIREYLFTKGYKVVNIRPNFSVNEQVPILPTALGIFSHYHCTQQVNLEIVPDEQGISQALLDCARDLASVNKEIQSLECRSILAKWWNAWRTLKDLAIPMDTYERYRMHAQGRGSMETAIDRISASADRIIIPEGRVLRSVAPAIRNRLQHIYSKLENSCPKAEYLMSLLSTARNNEKNKVLFVLSEKSQVSALREQLLFSNPELLESNPPLVHLAKAVSLARIKTLNQCVIPGVWAPWQNSVLLAIGASKLSILMYPYEANLVSSRIQAHVDECTTLSESTPNKQSYLPILNLSSQQEEVLENLKQSSKEEEPESPQWLNAEQQFAFDHLEDEDSIMDDDQATGGLIIKFDDDSEIVVRPHSEMMLVTDEGVESVFADALSVGDTVVILNDDVSRSIFESVLEQVNHLVKADMRVIELWRASIKKIMFKGLSGEPSSSVSSIIRSLRKIGCDKNDLTIRQWFKGITMAPSETSDICRVLQLSGVSRSEEIAKVVSREINVIRNFNRNLGRRIKRKIQASITNEKEVKKTRLDFEISEAIEAVEQKTIISKEIVG